MKKVWVFSGLRRKHPESGFSVVLVYELASSLLEANKKSLIPLVVITAMFNEQVEHTVGG